MAVEVNRLLREKAWEVAAVLNTIDDDEERQLAWENFGRLVDHELWCGAENRRQFTPALRAMGDAMLASVTGIRLVKGDAA